jgi:hypothetical protein
MDPDAPLCHSNAVARNAKLAIPLEWHPAEGSDLCHRAHPAPLPKQELQ